MGATMANSNTSTKTAPAQYGNTFTYTPGTAASQLNKAFSEWLNSGPAKGNLGAVQIVCLPNCTAPVYLPFTSMNTAKRGAIMQAIVGGVKTPQGTVHSVAAFMPYARQYGAVGNLPLDLLAALNGGFGPGRYYGTPFVKLVYNPKASEPVAVDKAAKAPAKAKATKAQPATVPAPQEPLAAPASEPLAVS